jgi:hypothetical protein
MKKPRVTLAVGSSAHLPTCLKSRNIYWWMLLRCSNYRTKDTFTIHQWHWRHKSSFCHKKYIWWMFSVNKDITSSRNVAACVMHSGWHQMETHWRSRETYKILLRYSICYHLIQGHSNKPHQLPRAMQNNYSRTLISCFHVSEIDQKSRLHTYH